MVISISRYRETCPDWLTDWFINAQQKQLQTKMQNFEDIFLSQHKCLLKKDFLKFQIEIHKMTENWISKFLRIRPGASSIFKVKVVTVYIFMTHNVQEFNQFHKLSLSDISSQKKLIEEIVLPIYHLDNSVHAY